jgi:hypothetical protein
MNRRTKTTPNPLLFQGSVSLLLFKRSFVALSSLMLSLLFLCLSLSLCFFLSLDCLGDSSTSATKAPTSLFILFPCPSDSQQRGARLKQRLVNDFFFRFGFLLINFIFNFGFVSVLYLYSTCPAEEKPTLPASRSAGRSMFTNGSMFLLSVPTRASSPAPNLDFATGSLKARAVFLLVRRAGGKFGSNDDLQ